MKQSDPQPPMQLAATQSISVYRSRAFRVTEGANLGDAQASMDELVLDDVYQLGDDASRHRLAIETLAEGGLRIAPDTAPGPALEVGDVVEFFGEYEWNEQGGVIHWTHHDPAGRHTDGWLRHGGRGSRQPAA